MQKWTINESELVNSVTSILDEIQTNLLNRTKDIQRQYTSRTNSYDTFKSILDSKGGFIYTYWCGEQSCEIKVKEETGADLRVIPFECKEDLVTNCCIYCRKPSNKIAIFGRAY
jgi:prolyl-tRNA synthetase